MSNQAQMLRESADAVASLGACMGDFEALDDGSLLEAQRVVGEHRRLLDTYAAWVAGQIDRRSRRELGYTGLAQRSGFLSPEALIQSVSGSTRAEAAKFVRVGEVMVSASVDAAVPGSAPELAWLAPVAAAVAAGSLGADAADAIRRGLGEVDDAVDGAALHSAVEALLTENLDADRLFRRAKELRDALDEAGIARREKERRDKRYFRVFTRPDGMVGGSFLLDGEDGQLLTSTIDTVMSPRRGGPRFVDPTAAASAEELLNDPRTNDQIAADTLMDIVRLAIDADPGSLFGTHRPAVRVIVRSEALDTRIGHARIEGQNDPVSLETADRYGCTGGFVGVLFDDEGQGLDVGRAQRLFTDRQRLCLAVRDGGCRFPGCDRPVAWTEAHHITEWERGGCTDIANGILLCRRHHLLIHNNHWQILRDRGEYWLRPPRAIDPAQELIAMPSRNPELAAKGRELQRA